jgi:hypothetical protein
VDFGGFLKTFAASGAPWWAIGFLIVFFSILRNWKTFSDCWLDHRKFNHKRDIDIRKIEASAGRVRTTPTGSRPTRRTPAKPIVEPRPPPQR